MKLFPHLAFLLFALSVYSQTAVVISDKADLRGTPSEKGRVVEQLKRDAVVEIIKQNEAWFLVQSVNYAGWIHGNAIKLTSTEADVSNRRPLVDLSNTVETPGTQNANNRFTNLYPWPTRRMLLHQFKREETYVDHSYRR